MNYIPILKGKEGEFNCLSELVKNGEERFMPLIEIVSPSEEDEESLEEFLTNKIIKYISKKWSIKRDFFLDFNLFNNFYISERTDNGERAAKFVYSKLRELGFIPTPVTSIKAHRDYQEDIQNIIPANEKGLCIRLNRFDIERNDLSNILANMLNYFNLDASQVDILIDLKYIEYSDAEDCINSIKKAINTNIVNINQWRSLTVGASSFPENLSSIEVNSEDTKLPRVEWLIWTALSKNKENLKRLPGFCDYSILHADMPKLDFIVTNRSAQIRYTLDEDWLIIKGKGVKHGGYKQTHVLSRILVEKDEFCGADFSWGDNHISKCAKNEVGSGNPSTWRKVENNHHITFVINQLSSYL